jgi:hypothetical protein
MLDWSTALPVHPAAGVTRTYFSPKSLPYFNPKNGLTVAQSPAFHRFIARARIGGSHRTSFQIVRICTVFPSAGSPRTSIQVERTVLQPDTYRNPSEAVPQRKFAVLQSKDSRWKSSVSKELGKVRHILNSN